MWGNSSLGSSGSSETRLCRPCLAQELVELWKRAPAASPRARTLPVPHNPFPPHPGALQEGLTRIRLGEGWQDQAFAACGWHQRAVEPQVLLLSRRARARLPCPAEAALPAPAPAALCHRVPSSPSEHDGCHQPRTQQRSRSPNSPLSSLRHKSLIILNN